MRFVNFFLLIIIIQAAFALENRKAASFHPVITDIANNIAGGKWQIKGLLKKGEDPHSFSPTPEDLKSVANSSLIMLSGKNLENYSELIKTSAALNASVIEVGKMIPSIIISESNSLFICCPAHSKGSIDPHWWHSIKNVQKAARIIAKEFMKLDPENKDFYKLNQNKYNQQLEDLYKWAKKELSSIPRKNRKLSTSHAAFGYFCREFSFKSLPVQGLNREHDPNPAHLAEIIEQIKKLKIKAVFPEKEANPKILTAMVQETGIRTGSPLLSSGPSEEYPTYIEMIKYNVTSIKEALANNAG